MLTTTREVRRVPGEAAYDVAPLAIPAEGEALDEATWPALALLVERAEAASSKFEVTDANLVT